MVIVELDLKFGGFGYATARRRSASIGGSQSHVGSAERTTAGTPRRRHATRDPHRTGGVRLGQHPRAAQVVVRSLSEGLARIRTAKLNVARAAVVAAGVHHIDERDDQPAARARRWSPRRGPDPPRWVPGDGMFMSAS